MTEQKQYYGGQAVLEGVMMKAPDGHIAVACRRPDGAIVVEERAAATHSQRYPFLKWPLLRGIYSFGEALYSGIDIINLSVEMTYGGSESEVQLTSWQMMLTVVAALCLSVGMFIILPTMLINLLHLDALTGGNITLKNLLESCLRLSIFCIYVIIIAWMPDIQRVFAYHGAEHQVINCYEAGLTLTPDNAAQYSRLHPRCGTSFLLLVMIISSLFFSLFGWPNLWLRVIYRLCLLPLIAGISYEVLRLMGRNQGQNKLLNILMQPGLQLQRLTTRRPDAAQLEVAIAALQRVLPTP